MSVADSAIQLVELSAIDLTAHHGLDNGITHASPVWSLDNPDRMQEETVIGDDHPRTLLGHARQQLHRAFSIDLPQIHHLVELADLSHKGNVISLVYESANLTDHRIGSTNAQDQGRSNQELLHQFTSFMHFLKVMSEKSSGTFGSSDGPSE
jgi:hypothetical protein